MEDWISVAGKFIHDTTWATTLSYLCLLLIVSWIANFIVKRIVLKSISTLLGKTWHITSSTQDRKPLAQRIANIVPALIIYFGISYIPHLSNTIISIVKNLTNAFIILTIALSISQALTIVNDVYSRKMTERSSSIKGYLQLINIIVFIIAAILIIAILMNRSPVVLLSGIGAMAAVLMLIFQDTILSLVSSVQISSSKIIRVGDWIEMPQCNADGTITDIALHSVKVCNWDKTETVIPTRKFTTEPYKNWRAMSESGGRHIKRSLLINQNSIHFLSDAELTHMRQLKLVDAYFQKQSNHVSENNLATPTQITNLEVFRIYVTQYLNNHSQINQNFTHIIRNRPPTAEGLPLELYCYSTETTFIRYEEVQSKIFDHLIAILPQFNLQLFQAPSGTDINTIKMIKNPSRSKMAGTSAIGSNDLSSNKISIK